MRQHRAESGIHQLLVGNGVSINVVLANQLESPREAGDRRVVDSAIVRFRAGTQNSKANPQIQENANPKEAVKNLPLHAEATVAQVRSSVNRESAGIMAQQFCL